MAIGPQLATGPGRDFIWKLLTSAAVISIAAACSPLTKSKSKTPKMQMTAPHYDKQPKRALLPKNPLHIATTYWANAYQKNPRDATAALSYAKNLKAIGANKRALAILKQAHRMHPGHPEIASEYGRLALARGHTNVALKALTRAHKPKGQTDWRVLSAQGTAYAKLNQPDMALADYRKGQALDPDNPIVAAEMAKLTAAN